MCAPNEDKSTCNGNTATDTTPLTTNSNTVTNSKWVLQQRPKGLFNPTKDVELVQETTDLQNCKDDEVIIETSMLSVDAFIRTMLDEEAYHGAVPLGGTVPAVGYGKVIQAGSKAKVKVGSIVMGMMGAQTHTTTKASQVSRVFTFPFMERTSSLGLMGLTTGLTAYTGVFYVSQRPRKGETVVVTGAAGAVGSIAAQLAKSTGAKVIGIAGGEKKKEFLLKDLALDGAVDYKATATKEGSHSIEEQLNELCPDGIDFVYDNVGGETLDFLLDRINPKGRVVICGAISQYSGNLNKGLVRGPSNYLKLAERGAEMKGFNVMQYMHKLPMALIGMFVLFLRKKVMMKEQIEQGIQSFPSALGKLFTGGHVGKMLVNIKP